MKGCPLGWPYLGRIRTEPLLCNEANAIWMAFDRGPIEGDAVYPWIAADIADVLSTKKKDMSGSEQVEICQNRT